MKQHIRVYMCRYIEFVVCSTYVRVYYQAINLKLKKKLKLLTPVASLLRKINFFTFAFTINIVNCMVFPVQKQDLQ